MKDYRIDPRPRPSSLPHLAVCPRWVSRPDDPNRNDGLASAARDGTLIHEKMEALADVALDKWEETIWNDPDLGPALAPLVVEAAAQVRDLFSMGLPVFTKASMGLNPEAHHELGVQVATRDGVFCEVGVSSDVAKHGTADLIVLTGNRAVLVDYKNVFVIRDHRAQLLAYIVGVFNALPKVDYVETRIVSPRIGQVHADETFDRVKDLPEIRAELEGIVERAMDPFAPGCPGEACATCRGNGNGCAWQCASLRDVPVEVSALVLPNAWLPMLNAVTPENRGQRRKLVKWLGDFCDSVKEQDKEWALANPDEELPGFTKSIQAGRASLDKTRLAEVNESLRLRFGLTAEVMSAFSVPDKEQLAEYVALGQGMTQADAEVAVKQCMNPFMRRGSDIVAFRAVKPKKGALTA